MAFISIIHKRSECIGCGFCIEAAPEYWQMNSNGEAELQSIVRSCGKFDHGEAMVLDQAILEDAADGCPVNIIRIT